MFSVRGVAVVLLVALAGAACSDSGSEPESATTSSTVAAPAADVEVTGPVGGGRRGVPYNPMPEGLAEEYGYTEEEFFVAGTATSYAASGSLGGDGRWDLEPAGEADYHTRILVRRPVNRDDFSGNILVEWLNVSAGRDSDPDFGFLHRYLLAEGWAYVGVSAQSVGVEGGGALVQVPGVAPEAVAALKDWDPERYGGLAHPGDDYSYDIFSDAGRLLRAPGDVDPLDGMRPQHLIAAGESQSGGYLAGYVNGVHPVASVYDGFLIHSRVGGGTPFAGGTPASPLTIRTDLDEPVLQFVTETDLTLLGHLAARQDDSETVMTWEVAGTAHADQTTLDYGLASGARWSSPGAFDPNATCGPVNRGPQAPVLRAALHALAAWVADGRRPPEAPLLEVADGEIVRAEHGNALGGIRTPSVDVPVATLTGAGNPVSIFCAIFGRTTPLPDDVLRSLYPTRDAYVAAVRAAAERAADQGFLLDADVAVIIDEARAADLPS